MSLIASQITSLTIVYSTVYSSADQRKYQSSASLAFVRGIHRGPVNSPHKGPVTRKTFPFDDVIMYVRHQDNMKQILTRQMWLCIMIENSDDYCQVLVSVHTWGVPNPFLNACRERKHIYPWTDSWQCVFKTVQSQNQIIMMCHSLAEIKLVVPLILSEFTYYSWQKIHLRQI